jgi:hypothetical protein
MFGDHPDTAAQKPPGMTRRRTVSPAMTNSCPRYRSAYPLGGSRSSQRGIAEICRRHFAPACGAAVAQLD